MNLAEVNLLWKEYKDKYNVKDDVMIDDVAFDAPEFVEGYFNIMELLEGKYILHLTRNIHTYDDAYVRFILFHEFTHFYDFIHRPFDKGEKLFLYMNAYSEFHACKLTLARAIQRFQVKLVDVDKLQIPGPYKETSIRTLLEETLWRAKVGFDYYETSLQPTEYAQAFRILMYLFGYLSLFKRDEELVRTSMKVTHQEDERIFQMYQALKDIDVDRIVTLFKSIGDDVVLRYLKAMFKKYYGDILTEQEIDSITLDNYQDIISRLEDEEEEVAFTSLITEELVAVASYALTGKTGREKTRRKNKRILNFKHG
ncbi:MAG: hypothetical protein U0K57_00915 [Lachnospiraceae bacterium]|nr:hypothetical protein [Lachnospiraceae bacterium]